MTGAQEASAGDLDTGTANLTVCVDAGEATARLVDDARRGLTSAPKDLAPKWFYDDRGSALFERITALPEYYPTRCEREILAARAGHIAALAQADTLLELGSGAATKTRLLLDGMCALGAGRYVAFDVCQPVVRQSAAAIAGDYPGLVVEVVVGDFEDHIHLVPRWGRQVVAFLGGTVGNLTPARRGRFLRSVRSTMQPGDHLLLGADLVKDPRRLVAAYDDAAGVTAEFNRNVLRVLNRQLGARFDPSLFDHVARWDSEAEWIEMRLRSRRDQVVAVEGLGLDVKFACGEEMRTEISAKFRPEGLESELAASGYRVRERWTDAGGDFTVVLAAAGG